MRIALVSREYGVAARSRVGAGVERIARELLGAGHAVRIITQAASDAIALEPRGRLVVHRIQLPPALVSWSRVVFDFAVEAARVVAELHRRQEVDIAEFPETEAAGAAALALRAGPARLPIVVTRYAPEGGAWHALQAVERLCIAGADATIDHDAPHERRLEVYAALLSGARLDPSAASDRLSGWREIRREAMGRRSMQDTSSTEHTP